MHTSRSPRLLIPSAENDRGDAGSENGSSAHRTRFKGHDERHSCELPRTQFFCRIADCQNFRVRGRIFGEFPLITAASNQGAVGINHDGAHWNVVGGEARTRLIERVRHVRIKIQTVTTSAVK